MLLPALPVSGAPSLVARSIEYKSADGTTLEGYVAYQDDVQTRARIAKRPLVLIVHDWDGLDEYEMSRARQIAGLGYVGLAVDVYGKGVRPTGETRGATAGKYRNDIPLFRQRLKAAYDAGTALPQVDAKRVGAMGYCFGGGGVLEMGRSGIPLRALVSFHGSVAPNPEDKNISGKTLVLHGTADKAVPPAQVEAFAEEMKGLRKSVRVVMYPGAEHSFTVPNIDSVTGSGQAYDPEADRKSFGEMVGFFRTNLGR